MRRFLPIVLLILFFQMGGYAQGKVKFPPYLEVVKKVGKIYPEALARVSVAQLWKKKSGYWLVERTPDKDIVIGQVWSSEKKAYLPEKMNAISTERHAYTFKHPSNIFYFNLMPYYGYMGYANDVVADYEDSFMPSDTILFALAVAHDDISSNYINDNRGTAKEGSGFELAIGDTLDDKQLAQYLEEKKASFKLFETIVKRNPTFKSMVGNVKDKLDCVRMSAFIDLCIYKSNGYAKTILEEGMFTTNWLFWAEQCLAECPKGAVLTTFGDLDTFTLLYAQAYLGIRRDVSVLNTSLLNTLPYIEYIRKGNLGALALELSLSPSEMEKNDILYCMLDKKGEQRLNAKNVLRSLIENPDYRLKRGELTYYNLPSALFSLGTQEGNSIHLTGKRAYITRADLVLIDLMANNSDRAFLTVSPQFSYDVDFKESVSSTCYTSRLYYPKENRLTLSTEDLNLRIESSGELDLSQEHFFLVQCLLKPHLERLRRTKDKDSAAIIIKRIDQIYPLTSSIESSLLMALCNDLQRLGDKDGVKKLLAPLKAINESEYSRFLDTYIMELEAWVAAEQGSGSKEYLWDDEDIEEDVDVVGD